MFSSLKNLFLSLLIGLGILTPAIPQPTPYLGRVSEVAALNAETRADKVSKSDVVGTYTDGKFGYVISIESINKIDGGVEVFARATKNGNKVGFGADGSVEIERFRFFNPPTLIDDPNGEVARSTTHPRTGESIVRKLRDDPAEALRQELAHTISLVARDDKKIILGKRGNTTSTFFPAAGANSPVDGSASHDQNTQPWSTTRNGAGNGTDNGTGTELTMHQFKIGSEFKNDRVFLLYDTSTIGAGQTVSSVTMSLAAGAFGVTNPDSTNYTFQACTPASNSVIVSGDYDNMTIDSPTEFLNARVAFSSWVDTAGTYNNHTLNASGIAAVDKTGITKYCWRNGSLDIDNVAPTGDNLIIARSADVGGTSSDPKLVVVHAAAANNVPNYWGMF